MAVKATSPVINEYHLHLNQPDQPQLVMYDLGDYLEKDRINTIKPHLHSFYQIIWFKSGTGAHFVDFKSYPVTENMIFFIGVNQVHHFDGQNPCQGILIHFNETFLLPNDSETNFFLKGNLFNNPYKQPCCPVGAALNPILNENMLQIARELKNRDQFGHEALLRSYLKAFLIQIQRRKTALDHDADHTSIALDEKRMQLQRFIHLIEQHYDKGMPVSQYARLLFISPRTLSALTHRLLRKTPSQMVQERVILAAQRMLLHSGLNVNQISCRLGFDDPSYFVKYFKKHTKASPTAFRKSIR